VARLHWHSAKLFTTFYSSTLVTSRNYDTSTRLQITELANGQWEGVLQNYMFSVSYFLFLVFIFIKAQTTLSSTVNDSSQTTEGRPGEDEEGVRL
jgi:hypothetical protein